MHTSPQLSILGPSILGTRLSCRTPLIPCDQSAASPWRPNAPSSFVIDILPQEGGVLFTSLCSHGTKLMIPASGIIKTGEKQEKSLAG